MPAPVSGVGLNLRLSYLQDIDRLPPTVDFWEVIAENLLHNTKALEHVCALRRDTPLSLHCLGMNLAGTDPLDSTYFARLRALIDRLDPFLVSDHLCWQRHQGVAHHDLLPFPLHDKSAAHVARRITQAQELLGRTIAVENLSYYIEFRSSTRSEADLLAHIASHTGCGLLLDLNNIEVNALNLGHDLNAYLSSSFLHHVVEVHIAGPEESHGLLIDTHGSLPSTQQLHTLQNTHQLHTLPLCYERDQHIPPLPESYTFIRALKTLRASPNTPLSSLPNRPPTQNAP